MLKTLSAYCLNLLGWSVRIDIDIPAKYVVIVAPHTSNWDFPIGILAAWASALKFYWVGKHTLFKWPFGYFMRAIGGIPVIRDKQSGFTGQIAQVINSHQALGIVIAPEGTRSKKDFWKKGFYYIASESQVPILMGFINYKDKTVGIGKSIMPSGNIETDLKIIKTFYQDKIGRYPDKQSDIQIKLNE